MIRSSSSAQPGKICFMGVMQSSTNLGHKIELSLERDEYFLFDHRSQVFAVHEFHGDEGLFSILAHIVNGDDIWMLQSGCGPGLAKKTRAQFLVNLATGGHHLNGGLALENGIESQVHHTHSSPAECALNLISSDLFSRHGQTS